MTSKLAIKPSKKDRPRSSDKLAANKSARRSKGGGTPDNKVPSPLADASGQNENILRPDSPASNQSELDKEIKSLKINPKDLKSSTAPSPPKVGLPTTKVLVKKKNPVSDSPKQHKRITVACRAPSSAEIKVANPEDYPGLRLDDYGGIIPHSILGSVEDFVEQAAKIGNLTNASVKSTQRSGPSPWPEDDVDKKPTSLMENGKITMDETRALENWERQMKIRKKDQQHLSETMSLPPDMLLMNQDGDFRMKQEDRALIDRAIPALDYGKGYRVGSEFWKQVETVGGEEGINLTLTQTERGFAPPVEHIGRPDLIRRSMGTDWTETRRMAHIHYPWLKSEYLQDRKIQLGDVINEIAPHRPYIDGLEVIGQSVKNVQELNNNEIGENEASTITSEVSENEDDLEDPLADYEDVVPLPIFGPSLTINGYSAQWKDLSENDDGDDSLQIRLQFPAETGTKSSNSIDITNDGTAAIYYSWKKIPASDPFGIKNSRPLQRFYFDTRNGVILPNDSIKIPFTFKSPNAGIFSETWQLETQPVLNRGNAIRVILRGISTEEDKLANQRRELEEELERRQKSTFIREIVQEIFNGVRTPPRPSTPIDTYITEEELFARQNMKMVFNTEAVTDLKYFHQQIRPDEDWDMSVKTLLEEARVNDDEEAKEALIQKLNEDVEMFAFEAEDAVQRSAYNLCYQMLCEAMDDFYVKAAKVRKSMGLPEKYFIVEVVQEEVSKKSKKGQSVEVQKGTPDKKLDSKKKDTRPASSRGKTSGNQKTRGKEGPTSSLATQRQLNVESASSKIFVPKVRPERPLPTSPLEVRYNDNLYIKLYDILRNLAERMEESL